MATQKLQTHDLTEIPALSTISSGKMWARGVTITYILFALATLGFVVFTFTQTVDLVAPNYYQMEVQYQERIAQTQRARELATPLRWFITPEHHTIEMVYPQEFIQRGDLSGTITFYRPSSPALDTQIPIQPDAYGKQMISTAKLTKGYWKISVLWKSNGLEYFKESDLML